MHIVAIITQQKKTWGICHGSCQQTKSILNQHVAITTWQKTSGMCDSYLLLKSIIWAYNLTGFLQWFQCICTWITATSDELHLETPKLVKKHQKQHTEEAYQDMHDCGEKKKSNALSIAKCSFFIRYAVTTAPLHNHTTQRKTPTAVVLVPGSRTSQTLGSPGGKNTHYLQKRNQMACCCWRIIIILSCWCIGTKSGEGDWLVLACEKHQQNNEPKQRRRCSCRSLWIRGSLPDGPAGSGNGYLEAEQSSASAYSFCLAKKEEVQQHEDLLKLVSWNPEDWSPDWRAKECEWPQQQEKKKDAPSPPPPPPPRLTLLRRPWYCRCTSLPWLSSSLQKLLAKPCIEVRQELMNSCPHLLQNLKKLSCPPSLSSWNPFDSLWPELLSLSLSVCLSPFCCCSLVFCSCCNLLPWSQILFSLSLPHRSLQLPELACYKFSATGLGFGVHVVVLIRGQRPSSKLTQCCRFAFSHIWHISMLQFRSHGKDYLLLLAWKDYVLLLAKV